MVQEVQVKKYGHILVLVSNVTLRYKSTLTSTINPKNIQIGHTDNLFHFNCPLISVQ